MPSDWRSTGLPSADARDDFTRARRRAAWAKVVARLSGRPGDVDVLLPFDEVVAALGPREISPARAADGRARFDRRLHRPGRRLRPAVPADQRAAAGALRAARRCGPARASRCRRSTCTGSASCISYGRPPPRRGRPRAGLAGDPGLRHRGAHGRTRAGRPRPSPTCRARAASGSSSNGCRCPSRCATRSGCATRRLLRAGRGRRGLGVPLHDGARRAASTARGGRAVVERGVRAGRRAAARRGPDLPSSPRTTRASPRPRRTCASPRSATGCCARTSGTSGRSRSVRGDAAGPSLVAAARRRRVAERAQLADGSLPGLALWPADPRGGW